MNAEFISGNMAASKIRTRRFMGSLMLVVGIILFALLSRGVTEPRYDGKSLSQWLVEVDYYQPESRRKIAQAAIQQMGTNVLPFLIRRFQNPGSVLPYYLNRALAVLPLVRFRFETSNERVRRATWEFDALGPVAEPAIPDLQRLLLQCPGYVPDALAGIGPGAIPALTECLTNDTLFYIPANTINAIRNAIISGKLPASYAESVLPVARRLAASTNSTASAYASGFLMQFSPASLPGVSGSP